MRQAVYSISQYERAAIEDAGTFAEEWLRNLPSSSPAADVMRAVRWQVRTMLELEGAEDDRALPATFARVLATMDASADLTSSEWARSYLRTMAAGFRQDAHLN